MSSPSPHHALPRAALPGRALLFCFLPYPRIFSPDQPMNFAHFALTKALT